MIVKTEEVVLKKLFLIAIVAFLAVQCSKNIISECDTCSTPPTGQKITFSEIQSSIFNQQCITCHNSDAPPAGLNLETDVAYANLVNVQSTTAAPKRVAPFKSAESYLVWVLEGEKAPLMPPSGRISQARIDSVIAWIDRGAENN